MKVDDIGKVLVVGAGTLGAQIGLQCAMHGFTVVLYDNKATQLEKALAEIRNFLGSMLKDRLTPSVQSATLERISTVNDPVKAAERVDLLIESVPENPMLKVQVFSQFGRLCPPHTVFATNTSTLLPSMFAAATGRPALFAALHFHPYVWDSNIVDIMPHSGTSAETMHLLQNFSTQIGQIPIVLSKENSSYVFNSMINAVISTALNLVIEGVASIEDVDRSWMGIMKLPVGPFGSMDQIGLDVLLDVHKCWAGIIRDRQLLARIAFLEKYVAKGRLGVKTQQGFYTYPNPAYTMPSFVTNGAETVGPL